MGKPNCKLIKVIQKKNVLITSLSEFIKLAKFPSEEEALSRLTTAMYAEYGYHDELKEIYESKFNEKVIEKVVMLIYQRGGMQALMQNYKAMWAVSPTSSSLCSNISNAVEKISVVCEKVITDWKSACEIISNNPFHYFRLDDPEMLELMKQIQDAIRIVEFK